MPPKKRTYENINAELLSMITEEDEKMLREKEKAWAESDGVEPIVLSPEDEEMMGKAWDKVGAYRHKRSKLLSKQSEQDSK